MSLINQVLLDLEKRRASAAERGVLPGQVRALPKVGGGLRWRMIAAVSLAGAAVIAGASVLLTGSDATRERPAISAPRAGSPEAAIEKVVAVSAGVTTLAALREESEGAAHLEALASRLTFELSNPPEVAEPLPAARVVGRTAVEPAAGDEAAAVPDEASRGAVRPESAKAAGSTAARPRRSEARPAIQKEVRQPTARDLAENEYRKAALSLNQGRLAEAREGFGAALNLYPAHQGARQAVVGLLLADKKLEEAERVLEDGIKLAPAQTGFAVTLARLQVNRGETAQAIATLQMSLDHAQGSADYAAFLAALLQRQGRHEEAI